MNEYLYYKSVFDVCVYADSEVAGISAALGTENYKNAVAGVCGNRLYLSMEDQEGAWQLLVYDTAAGVWTREDGTHALGFASCLTETFMLRADGELYALLPGEYNKDFFMVGSDYTVYAQEETDEEVSWELRTGEILRELPGSQVHWENTAVPGAGPGGEGGGGPAPGRRGMGEGTGAERRRSAALHPAHLPQAVRPDGDSPDGGGPCAAGELEQIRGIWE